MKATACVSSLLVVLMAWMMMGFAGEAASNRAEPRSRRSAAPKTLGVGKRFARLATAYELDRLHQKGLGGAGDDRWEDWCELYDHLRSEFLAESGIRVSWKAKVLPAEKEKRPALTEFEKEALSRIEQGENEIWQPSGSGTVLYMRPIRARQGCMICHGMPKPRESASPWPGPGESISRLLAASVSKPGEMMGIISLKIEARAAEAGEKAGPREPKPRQGSIR